MTPEQEDALVLKTMKFRLDPYDLNEAIRLAIRAAYAQGREDAAIVCEKEWDSFGVDACAISCAAAIRRGE